jgi:hypothetical protein
MNETQFKELKNTMKSFTIDLTIGSKLLIGIVVLTAGGVTSARADVISDWNATGETYITQYGPKQEERGLAMMHVAQFDAVNAALGGYTPYAAGLLAPGASPEAAAAQAAYAVLTNISRANLSTLNSALAQSLASIPDGPAKTAGVQLGQTVAGVIIGLRSADNLDLSVSDGRSNAIGRWRPTPPNFSAGVAAELRYLTPFTLTTIAQFRQGPPPALTSALYAADYNEVRLIGGRVSTNRTPDQADAAWFYENLNYPDVWKAVLPQHPMSLIESARLYALLYMAINDAAASCCATKYFYGFWRPITAIQNGELDGNPDTPGDAAWTSFSDTHPHPDYPSLASQITGAMVEVLIAFLGDDFSVEIFPGNGNRSRKFNRLSALFEDVVTGRVAAGMHFRNSCLVAVETGRQIGRHALRNFLRPLPLLTADGFPKPGEFQLSLSAGPAVNYIIETSNDLTTWLPWQTNTIGKIQFIDTNAVQAGPRFYRVQAE